MKILALLMLTLSTLAFAQNANIPITRTDCGSDTNPFVCWVDLIPNPIGVYELMHVSDKLLQGTTTYSGSLAWSSTPVFGTNLDYGVITSSTPVWGTYTDPVTNMPKSEVTELTIYFTGNYVSGIPGVVGKPFSGFATMHFLYKVEPSGVGRPPHLERFVEDGELTIYQVEAQADGIIWSGPASSTWNPFLL